MYTKYLVYRFVYTNLFCLIVKQAFFAYVNHARTRSCNQPVLSNDVKVSLSRKQRELLMGLKLTNERHPAITSQTCYPLLNYREHHTIDDSRVSLGFQEAF